MCKKLIFLTSFVLVLGVSAGVTKADIIAYWPFDEGTGDVAKDVVGGFDVQLTSIDWVVGQFDGSALECNRSGDEILAGSGPTPTTQDLSIAWWMVDNYDSYQTMMNKNETNSVAGNNILLRPTSEDSPLRWRLGGWQVYGGWGSECRVPAGAYNDGEWVHVVCTYDYAADTATIYIDGELAALPRVPTAMILDALSSGRLTTGASMRSTPRRTLRYSRARSGVLPPSLLAILLMVRTLPPRRPA